MHIVSVELIESNCPFTSIICSWKVKVTPPDSHAGDLNGDGVVNFEDLTLVTSNFGKSSGDPGFDAMADGNNDGVVNIEDLILVTSNFGKSY
jgi:hypothetical protein